MKIILRGILFTAIFIAMAVSLFAYTVWSQRPGNRPSSHFRNLDRNHNGAVSLAEWSDYYASRSGWPSSEWDFHFMDCDKDNAVTWREYRDRTFHGQFCGNSFEAASRGLPPRPMPEGSFSFCVTDARTGVQSCEAGQGTLQDFRDSPEGSPMQILHSEPPPIP